MMVGGQGEIQDDPRTCPARGPYWNCYLQVLDKQLLEGADLACQELQRF